MSRPVGFRGKLIHRLDPNGEPEVLDVANLVAEPGWTGLALIPERRRGVIRAAQVLAASAALALVAAVLVARPRKPTPTPTNLSV